MKYREGRVALVSSVLVLLVATPAMEVRAQKATLPEAIEAFNRQEYAEAGRMLSGSSDKAGDNGVAIYYLGRLALIGGRLEEAVGHFKQAIEIAPENSEYHHWLATAEMRRIPYRSFPGKVSGSMKVLKELRTAIELDPGNLMARMTLFQMMARSYGMPGSNRETLREQANAMAGIDAVMGHMANGTLFQLVEKDTAKAGTHFELGHALGPDNRAAALSYADYLWDTGSRDEALAVLDSFVENAPRDKPAHFNLAARLILSGGDYDGAKDTLERCLVLKSDTGMPSESMVRWCLGLVYHLLGEDARAQAEWSRAYDLDSDFNKVLEAVPMMTELKSLLDNQKGAAR